MSPRVGRIYGQVPSLWGGTLAVFALALLGGCNSSEEEFTPETPPAIVFEGEIEPALVGQWETKSKLSSLDLKAEGTALMTNVAPGRGTSTTKGEWRLADKRLLFRVEGMDRVNAYEVEFDTKKLRMKQKSTKLDIEYLRLEPSTKGKKS